MAVSILEYPDVWKEIKTTQKPYLKGGVYYEGEVSISYTKFEGMNEPYDSGDTSMVTPAGVHSKDARILYTNSGVELRTYESTGDKGLADKVYLKDPSLDTSVAYIVQDEEEWDIPNGFVNFDGEDRTYLIVKEEKVK